jgi:hypothetical protein
MKTIEERILENYILGCIKYKGNYSFYLMPIAWWILNYAKYSPSILENKERVANFRNGILVVDKENIKLYLKNIEEDKLTDKELMEISNEINRKYPEEGYSYLNFFIDFDNKEYINGFYDIEMEDYLPDDTWNGKFDEPLKYLPSELRQCFMDEGIV